MAAEALPRHRGLPVRHPQPCPAESPAPLRPGVPGRRGFPAAAWRKPQTVRARLSSPAFAFATMPWKYPPGVDRKCAAGFAETMAMAIAACSRPMAMPQSDFETPSSPRLVRPRAETAGGPNARRRHGPGRACRSRRRSELSASNVRPSETSAFAAEHHSAMQQPLHRALGDRR
jgi:hypothetical protein